MTGAQASLPATSRSGVKRLSVDNTGGIVTGAQASLPATSRSGVKRFKTGMHRIARSHKPDREIQDRTLQPLTAKNSSKNCTEKCVRAEVNRLSSFAQNKEVK